MEFAKLIECDMRNIFFWKCGGETIPNPFLKNENWEHFSGLIG